MISDSSEYLIHFHTQFANMLCESSASVLIHTNEYKINHFAVYETAVHSDTKLSKYFKENDKSLYEKSLTLNNNDLNIDQGPRKTIESSAIVFKSVSWNAPLILSKHAERVGAGAHHDKPGEKNSFPFASE